MFVENPLLLLLMGYALGVTCALVLVVALARREPQPTVVVQQAPVETDPLGCGGFLLLLIMLPVAFLFISIVSG